MKNRDTGVNCALMYNRSKIYYVCASAQPPVQGRWRCPAGAAGTLPPRHRWIFGGDGARYRVRSYLVGALFFPFFFHKYFGSATDKWGHPLRTLSPTKAETHFSSLPRPPLAVSAPLPRSALHRTGKSPTAGGSAPNKRFHLISLPICLGCSGL